MQGVEHFSEAGVLFWASEAISAIAHLHSLNVIYRYLQPGPPGGGGDASVVMLPGCGGDSGRGDGGVAIMMVVTTVVTPLLLLPPPQENMLITTSGHLKLKEVGLCRPLKEGQGCYTLAGVPEYLPPEAIMGKSYGTKYDCWALGVIIYEMASGATPFYNENVHVMYTDIVRGEYAQIGFQGGILSDSLRCVIQALLVKDPSQRWSCDDVQTYLDVDWEDVLANANISPYIPQIDTDDDTLLYEQFDTPCNGDSLETAKYTMKAQFEFCDGSPLTKLFGNVNSSHPLFECAISGVAENRSPVVNTLRTRLAKLFRGKKSA
jgi:serine/threonine protein kinase